MSDHVNTAASTLANIGLLPEGHFLNRDDVRQLLSAAEYELEEVGMSRPDFREVLLFGMIPDGSASSSVRHLKEALERCVDCIEFTLKLAENTTEGDAA